MPDPIKPKPRGFKEYFFTYSWSEAGAVRALRNTWVGFYLSFAAAGLVLDPFQHGMLSAFCFGAIANYPGYMLGLRSQRREDPQAIVRAELMVWQFGNLAKVFAAIGVLVLANQAFRG